MIFDRVSLIGAANGWAITTVGMLTVFLGLLSLFIIISQLHKLILLWENKTGLFSSFKLFRTKEPFPGYDLIKKSPPSILEQARQLYILSNFLGEDIILSKILKLAKKRDIYISPQCIKVLIDNGILIPIEKDRYYWVED